MAKKKESRFRGKVSSDIDRQESGAHYGHLKIPKGIGVYSPEPGKTSRMDIIPYVVTDKRHPNRNADEGVAVVGELWYKRPYRIHRNVGVEKDTVVCPSSIGKPCPICEYRKKLQDNGAKKDELKPMNSSQRNLYVIVPIGVKDVKETLHILDMAQTNFQDKINEEIKDAPKYEIFPDLEEGLTLKTRWLSSTFANSKPYAEAGRIDFEAREESYDESILEKVPSLDEVLVVLTYDELKEKFFEEEATDEKIVEDDEVPVRKKKVVKDDDEDEEEVAPIRKGKKKPVEDDEDEDETPRKKKVVKKDDDDEDEAPKKSKKKPVEDEDEPAPEMSWDELSELSWKKLKALVKENPDFDLDLDDFTEDDPMELAHALAFALEIEIPKKSSKKKPVEDDDEDEVPKKKAKKPVVEEDDEDEAPVKKSDKNKCPHGHRFGKDFDKKDECDGCKKYDDCEEAS